MKLSSISGAPLAAFLALASACVSPPDAQEVLDTGFRTPEMTFHTLQVGVRAGLPRLEYACLSSGFRARHGLSQLGYREFREQELEDRLEFWLGIPDAKIVESLSQGPGRHLIRAESHGHPFELGLVHEEFWQAWSGDELLADELLEASLPFEERLEIYRSEGGGPILSTVVQFPAEMALLEPEELRAAMTELRIAKEWKIDHIGGFEGPPEP